MDNVQDLHEVEVQHCKFLAAIERSTSDKLGGVIRGGFENFAFDKLLRLEDILARSTQYDCLSRGREF